MPCSVAASISSPTGKSTVTSSSVGGRATTTTTTTSLPGSRARRPSTLQYCLKATAATPRLAPPPATPPDDRPADHEVEGDVRPSAALPPPPAAAAAAVWPTNIVAPKATPEDSLIDSCSTDGDEGPEYRLLSLACDEIGDHLRATANTSHLDLLNRPPRVAAPIADEDDDVDDDDFDLSEGRPVELCRLVELCRPVDLCRPVELCRDELPPESVAVASATAQLEPTSPDPFRYIDVLAARSVSVVNSCDATGFPQRRQWSTSPGAGLVGSGTSLPARLAVTASSLPPRQARSSTLPRSAASLLQRAADSSETLTPCSGSLAGGLGTASTLTKKRSLTLSVGGGGAVSGGSAGRLTTAATAVVDSPTAARFSPPDSPVSRFCHLGAHALDVFYSPADDDDDDDEAEDTGVAVGRLPASTAASGAGTFWRPVACTAAVDRRRRPTSQPPSLSQLITQPSPPSYRRPRLSSHPPAPPTMRPSTAPLVGLIEGFSDIDSTSISDDEDDMNQASNIRPPPPTGVTASPSASTTQPPLRQSSRSCSKHEAASSACSSQSTWLTTPAESSTVHRDSHSPATDTVWPAETLRPR